MSAVPDIFNALGQRLEKWRDIKDRDYLMNILKLS
jgi:hypothetical protein